jgi:predicted kinase
MDPETEPVSDMAGEPAPGRAALVLVAGLPASGKSVFARALVRRIGGDYLSSDAMRPIVAGGAPTYSTDESAALYEMIGRISRDFLVQGRRVIIDATSLYPEGRALTLAAAPAGTATALVWTTVDEATDAARLAARAAGLDSEDNSEADAEVRARMASFAVPPTLDEAGLVLIMRPEDFAASLDAVAAWVEKA